MIKLTVLFAFILIFASCQNAAKYNIDPEAKKYLEECLDILQTNSIKKHQINWEVFRDQIFSHANGAKSISDTYSTIELAIDKLEDKHSYFAPNLSQNEDEQAELPLLPEVNVPPDIGYLRLPFCIGDVFAVDKYVTGIYQKIKHQNSDSLKGWIVDLRGNFGGNMWPMLLAIGPLLGEGEVGYFVDADERYQSWAYRNGKVYLDSIEILSTSEEIPNVKNLPFIAVLTDSITASSGEAIAVAFKGRKNCKSFGSPTFGVSTGNLSHTLSDSSRINLTQSIFSDRNKIKYGEKIIPDFITDENIIIDAVKWITSRN